MADQKQVAMLLRSVEEWNAWRRENVKVRPDLIGANLSEEELSGINLSGVDLTRACLMGANLGVASLRRAHMSAANLSSAHLVGADLLGAKLSEANLTGANISGADLTAADLTGADVSVCTCRQVTFADLDLSVAKGLADVNHFGRSTIGTDTLVFSKGRIPDEFLRGCGLSDWEIEAAKLHNPSLREDQRTTIAYEVLRIMNDQPIKYESLFISYSTEDQGFAEKLHADLEKAGVRCWFAPHDVRGGKKLPEQLDRAIHMQDRLLLLLSESSMNSNWVENEIMEAFTKQEADGTRKLFPIRLTKFEMLKAWKVIEPNTGKDLAREIREYFIPDFSDWQKPDAYEAAFEKLLEALKPE